MNTTKPYLDAFVFPIAKSEVEFYQGIAQQVAEIWKEHGAITYSEYISDDGSMPGFKTFSEFAGAQDGEVVVMGWATFPSKEIRDLANAEVKNDLRMGKLVGPLMQPDRMIFDPSRMIFGSFLPLVE